MKYDAASTYDRIKANYADEHGLTEEEYEAQIRLTTLRALAARGQLLPEMKK